MVKMDKVYITSKEEIKQLMELFKNPASERNQEKIEETVENSY